MINDPEHVYCCLFGTYCRILQISRSNSLLMCTCFDFFKLLTLVFLIAVSCRVAGILLAAALLLKTSQLAAALHLPAVCLVQSHTAIPYRHDVTACSCFLLSGYWWIAFIGFYIQSSSFEQWEFDAGSVSHMLLFIYKKSHRLLKLGSSRFEYTWIFEHSQV